MNGTSHAIRYMNEKDQRPQYDLFSETGSGVDLVEIHKQCIAGRLRHSYHRSIIWRILLKVLPVERLEWTHIITRERREYDLLKEKHATNPRLNESLDTEVHNPLSQKCESPWQRFFADKELREQIEKDVERTFPEIEFFQRDDIRRDLSSILYTYAKLNPDVVYRQGMHEILAPVLFVIHSDLNSYYHTREQRRTVHARPWDHEQLDVIYNTNYVEQDAFAIFSRLMIPLKKWYTADECEGICESAIDRLIGTLPFSKENGLNSRTPPNSELLRKLAYIHDTLLPSVDPQLHGHLSSLEIDPSIYGIRWLRLLFGREFALQDLLYLWDVVLLDNYESDQSLLIVDYVFLALLLQIRDYLLESDYTSCILYLVRYPIIVDVDSFVRFVLHLKSPKKYSKPSSAMPTFSHITLSENPNVDRMKSEGVAFNSAGKSNFNKHSGPIGSVLNRIGRQVYSDPFSVQSTMLVPQRRYTTGSPVAKSNSVFYTGIESKLWDNNESRSSNQRDTVAQTQASIPAIVKKHSYDQLDLMKEQVSILQSRVNNAELIGQVSAQQLVKCCDQLSCLQCSSEEIKEKVIQEILHLAEQLSRSTTTPSTPIQIHNNTSNQRSVSRMETDLFELASEAGSSPSVENRPRIGSASTSLAARSLRKENELTRLDRRKNF